MITNLMSFLASTLHMYQVYHSAVYCLRKINVGFKQIRVVHMNSMVTVVEFRSEAGEIQ